MKIAKCRTCDAEIIWAKSNKMKPIPIDAEPIKGGNVELITAPGGVVYAKVLGSVNTEESRYVSHFVTCPHANEWKTSHR